MSNGTIHVAAVDLGASSGRVIRAEVGPGTLKLDLVARFPNAPVRTPDGLHWNVLELYDRALDGLRTASRLPGGIVSAAVDSWAVDYGLIRDGRLLGTPFHYRDERTAAGVSRVHEAMSHRDLYERNGLQFLPFNTVYQLAADPWVADAQHLLLIPDLLTYWLTGELVAERTNASTTGLLDIHTGLWDDDLVARLNLPRGMLGRLVDPGEVIGRLLPDVAERVGGQGFDVIAVGSHDTASAVVGVPIQTDDAAYISCGTWGLVGVELEKPVISEAGRAANFTNEGGVDGRIRFLTNVMGLWLLSECLRTWQLEGRAESLESLLAAAEALPSPDVFDVQDPRFLAPGDMPSRIRKWYDDAGLPPPVSRPSLVRTIVDSLAEAFANALEQAETLSGHAIRTVHVVGGGAQNSLLCQATADRSGRVVLAGPVEATAIGNVLAQGRSAEALPGTLEELRRLVAETHRPRRFAPRAAPPPRSGRRQTDASQRSTGS